MVDIYETEQEQIDAVKQWWSDNGRSVIIGLVLGVTVLLCWNGWNSYIQKRNEQASQHYFSVVSDIESDQSEKALGTINQLAEKYESTHYASLAQLMGAKISIESGNVKNATERLQWVVSHSKQKTLRSLAYLRLTDIYLSEDSIELAENALSNIKHSAFIGRVNELKGDLALMKGDKKKAAQLYQDSLSSHSQGNAFVQMKLDNIGVESVK